MFSHVAPLPYLYSWLLYEYSVLRALFAGSMTIALRLLVVFIAALRVLSIVTFTVFTANIHDAYSPLRSKIGYLTLIALRRNSIHQAPPCMTKGNKTQSKWWATQRPRGCACMHTKLQPAGLPYDEADEMPFYVKIFMCRIMVMRRLGVSSSVHVSSSCAGAGVPSSVHELARASSSCGPVHHALTPRPVASC